MTVNKKSKENGDNMRSWGRALKEAGQDADLGFVSAAVGGLIERNAKLWGQKDSTVTVITAVARATSIAAREQENYNEMVELSREVSGRQRTAYDKTTIATNKMRVAQDKMREAQEEGIAIERLIDYNKKVVEQRRVTVVVDKATTSYRLQEYHLSRLQLQSRIEAVESAVRL